MKILILEDSEVRVNKFKKKFSEHELFITDNANQAIEYLKEYKFGLICLDHDLGDKQMEWDEDNNGMMVVKYLNEYGTNGAKVVVHSLNTPRAQIMVSIIPDAVFIPFYWLNYDN